MLAIELQRLHIELNKLFGVVKEFQEKLGNDTELSTSPVAAFIDKYINDIKDIYRIVSELDKANFEEAAKCNAGRDLSATALALQQENDCLRRRIDQLQSEKKGLEKQLVCVEEMIVLARELKDENQGLICDFRNLKDSIAIEQENDALEIVELKKAFKELIADNQLLRRKNKELASRMQQFELVYDSTSSTERQEHIYTTADDRQVVNMSSLCPVVEECSQVTSDLSLIHI